MINVSIIVPNYNHAKYLRQRLDSIFNQTFQDFEVILLDDCSTDHSVDILSEYAKHPKVSHFVINEVNSGSTFKQWKKGIELAKGEWIWIAESDDFCEDTLLETVLSSTQKWKSLAIAYCQSVDVDQSGKPIRLNKWAKTLDRWHWDSDYINTGINELANYLIIKNTIPNASGTIFKHGLLNQNTLNILGTFRFCGDWFLWVSLLSENGIAFSRSPLNYFRKHSGSTTAKKRSIEVETSRIKEYLSIIRKVSEATGKKINFNLPEYNWLVNEQKGRWPFFDRLKFINSGLPLNLLLKLIGPSR